MLPGEGSPSRMTPSSVLSAGSVTETVLENCSAAYTRSRWLTGISGAEAGPGAWPADAGAMGKAAAANTTADAKAINERRHNHTAAVPVRTADHAVRRRYP